MAANLVSARVSRRATRPWGRSAFPNAPATPRSVRYATSPRGFVLRPRTGRSWSAAASLKPSKLSRLGKLGAGMNHVVSIKTYLTDLCPYTVFSRIRGEFFPKDPPTSTAVQVAGLLLNAKIEIDAVAFLPAGAAA